MTIEKGKPWGTVGSLPPEAPTAASDAEAARLIASGVTGLRLCGGDLARTLGLTGRPTPAPNTLVPVDAIEVEIDDRPPSIALAHVVFGRPWPMPRVVVANTAFIGQANIAPRAHPGDGLLDVLTFDLGLIDGLKAARRVSNASHLPHPGIDQHRATEWHLEHRRAQLVRIDGRPAGRARSVRCRVLPEAVEIEV